VAHELVHGRSHELLDRISWNLVELCGSGHHYLPTYQILMISDNVDFLPPIFYAVFWQPFWKFWKSTLDYNHILLQLCLIIRPNFAFRLGHSYFV
jgi:hypothetical protein